jgi:hypothetical protein
MDIFCHEEPGIHKNSMCAAFVDGMELWFYVSTVILVSMAFPGFKFQKFSGGLPRTPLIMHGFGVCHGQGFRPVSDSKIESS